MTREEILQKANPILFNTDMVRAILDNRKSVTRRICKDGNDYTVPDMSLYDADKRTYAVHNYAGKEHTEKLSITEKTCPICTGDYLYVRETWGISNFDYDDRKAYVVYKAGDERDNCRGVILPEDKFQKIYNSYSESEPDWHPSIHMPKEAARIFLRVTDVRVERLCDITEEGAVKEGLYKGWHSLPKSSPAVTAKQAFMWVWDRTVKLKDRRKYGWVANPWVWVIRFERVEV